jgi:hypothetical protein
MGLTIDAAVNAQKTFKIDPNRVYVCGVSGGGRVASMLGVGFPDVFRGGFYIIGCNFYRQERSVEQNGVFKRSYNVPPTKYYVMAKKQNKHVFLTGDTDGNREQTEIYYKGFVRDGFEHSTYFQVPGMGHSPPPQDWFAKGMDALDAKLPDPATTTRPVAKTAAAAVTPTTRKSPATQPARTPAEDAQKLLAHAKLFVDAKQYPLAREKLRYIVAQYPGTPGVRGAAKLLEDIANK